MILCCFDLKSFVAVVAGLLMLGLSGATKKEAGNDVLSQNTHPLAISMFPGNLWHLTALSQWKTIQEYSRQGSVEPGWKNQREAFSPHPITQINIPQSENASTSLKVQKEKENPCLNSKCSSQTNLSCDTWMVGGYELFSSAVALTVKDAGAISWLLILCSAIMILINTSVSFAFITEESIDQQSLNIWTSIRLSLLDFIEIGKKKIGLSVSHIHWTVCCSAAASW